MRDRLVQLQRDWLTCIAGTARSGVQEGHFRADLDPQQFAHDAYGVMLAYHHAARLLSDAKAPARVKSGFETLLTAARRRPRS